MLVFSLSELVAVEPLPVVVDVDVGVMAFDMDSFVLLLVNIGAVALDTFDALSGRMEDVVAVAEGLIRSADEPFMSAGKLDVVID